jgi:ferredoxin
VVRHLDDERGLLSPDGVREFVGADVDGDAYICGPEPFMALVESALPGPGRVYSERFGGGPPPAANAVEGTVTIQLDGTKTSVPRRENETLLESARRAGLSPPFNCQAGNCATCMAKLTEGRAVMRVNDALTDEEVAEGYVLTCQGIPETPSVTVVYE